MIVIVMGVCGAGKTTVGKLLAESLHARFEEGDKFHPPANVAKMSNGEPLTDADRRPWLENIAASIDAWQADGTSIVLTCSALKKAYRRILAGDRTDVCFLYLKGDADTLAQRMRQRRHHFMPASLLPSQLETLEEPQGTEQAIVADICTPPAQIASDAAMAIRARQGA